MIIIRFALICWALTAQMALALEITWNFEGGRLVSAERVKGNHYRVMVDGEKDHDGRNRQATWYYFRVDGAPKSGVTLDVVGLPGEYNYQPNKGAITGEIPPYISYDQKTWEVVDDSRYDAAEPRLRLEITPAAKTFWIAHVPPYTNTQFEALRGIVRGRPSFSEEVIGKSVGGRELYLWTIGEASPAKRTAWLMCRQHSWEAPTSQVCEAAVLALTADDAAGQALRQNTLWKILPFNDPDGVARGGVRFNANGYDLNRNWDVFDPKLMPEIAAQRAAIARWLETGHTIDFFLTLHNTETSEYLSGPPAQAKPDDFAALGDRLFSLLQQKTAFDPSRPFFLEGETTTAGKPGRMNVVQGLSRDFHLPAFLMEQRIARVEKLRRRPTVRDRNEFGAQLVQVIAEALQLHAQGRAPSR
jgi:hypothetical protein